MTNFLVYRWLSVMNVRVLHSLVSVLMTVACVFYCLALLSLCSCLGCVFRKNIIVLGPGITYSLSTLREPLINPCEPCLGLLYFHIGLDIASGFGAPREPVQITFEPFENFSVHRWVHVYEYFCVHFWCVIVYISIFVCLL